MRAASDVLPLRDHAGCRIDDPDRLERTGVHQRHQPLRQNVQPLAAGRPNGCRLPTRAQGAHRHDHRHVQSGDLLARDDGDDHGHGERADHGSDAAGGWDIQATQATTNAIDDIVPVLEKEGVETGDIAATARIASIAPDRTQIRMAGDDEWQTYRINGATDAFIEQSDLPLQTRAVGYDSDQAVWDAVRNDPSLVVVDNNALGQGGDLAAPANQFVLEDVSPDDETMRPAAIEIGDPVSGTVRTFTVVGVMDAKVVAFPGVTMSDRGYGEMFRGTGSTSFITHVIRLAPNADAEQSAKSIESALVAFGVQATTYDEILDTMTRTSRGFLTLIEAFMMLGLVVGVAALGVLAFRSVVERHQQIGMLRAIGYKRSMVSASFLIESSMITVLGIISGTVLGLLLSWNLISGDYAFGESVSMVIPFGEIGVFLLVALAASLLMAWIPSRRAASVPVADALRYE
ncbi:MAG: FtsX-like permease family protein [Thermomicrobiales bacterium]